MTPQEAVGNAVAILEERGYDWRKWGHGSGPCCPEGALRLACFGQIKKLDGYYLDPPALFKDAMGLILRELGSELQPVFGALSDATGFRSEHCVLAAMRRAATYKEDEERETVTDRELITV